MPAQRQMLKISVDTDYAVRIRIDLTRSHTIMSRLIFRNLPTDLTPDSFRAKLTTSTQAISPKEITDLKLVPKRRFAFVGYKDEALAARAKEWFDGTYAFGGGKVKVEFVRDEPLSKAPEKKERKSTKSKPVVVTEDIPEASGSKPNKRLREFMDVMKGVDPSAPTAGPSSKAGTSASAAVPGEPGWKAEGLPGSSAAADKNRKSRKGKEKSEEPEEGDGAADTQQEDEDDDAAWLRRRKNAALVLEGEGVEGDGDVSTPSAPAVPSDPTTDLILSTGRLFVRNLPFVTTSPDLSGHFGRYGHVEEVHMPVSSTTGDPLGTAYVLFRDPANALEAYNALDKTTFQGRLLHVLPGRAKPGQQVTTAGAGTGKKPDGEKQVLGKTKEGRDDVRAKGDAKKKDASARGVNWASLYMNSDAVAASVADRMGISKSELLNGDDSNAAVKLALAETTVIAETKKYFEDAGINVEALQPRVPRSRTVILVKNIPYGTTIHTLTDLFAAQGALKRILLPPSGTLGVVEYEHAQEAAKAFRALAYRRLGNAVLYLEKGPEGMFANPDAPTLQDKQAEEKRLLAEKVAAAAAADEDTESAGGALRDQPDENDEAGSTLFLKNLSFGTTTERLVSVLSSLAGFSFARVQTKPDPKRPGERLSMGYGFVGFKTKDAARRALGGLQGFEVDGHAVEARFAQRGADADAAEARKDGGAAAASAKNKSTKVLVKNLPFETTKADVRTLFSAYGTLKSLRLPRKPTLSAASGTHAARGFAFLEFTTHAEAQRAMDALKHTHLLGRHLVIEWAREDDAVDVDKLREKVGREKGAEGERKRRKLDLGGKAAADDNDGMEF